MDILDKGHRKIKMSLFSIIVVCLNPGKKLKETVDSILMQTQKNVEIIIKDGNSTDGAVEALEKRKNIRIFRQADQGIYDAMNQAAALAEGEILFFLNCGDKFHDEKVLENVQKAVQESSAKIFYGDIFSVLTRSRVPSNPHIDAFGCYRNVPCHQACFYRKELFEERGYLLQYKVRADYEHFLWSFFEKQAAPLYLPLIVADYEGGGFSETKESKKVSAVEHKEITAKYMSRKQLFQYKLILGLTLAPLRSRFAESERFSKMYNAAKRRIYRKR